MNTHLAVKELVENLLQKKGDTAGFLDADSLVVSGRLDSVDALDIVVFLEESYGIDFVDQGFDINEVDSVDSIISIIENRRR
jgi:acyl carrier protein